MQRALWPESSMYLFYCDYSAFLHADPVVLKYTHYIAENIHVILLNEPVMSEISYNADPPKSLPLKCRGVGGQLKVAHGFA